MNSVKTIENEIDSENAADTIQSAPARTGILKLLSDRLKINFSAGNIASLHPLKLTVFLFLINTLIMLCCVQLGLWSDYRDPGRYFREGRLITWLSTFQLLFVGYICGRVWKLESDASHLSWKSPSGIWKFCSLGFYFLALDEILKIHEALDRYSHKALGVAITDTSDHLDDLIVVLYAVIGIAALLYYIKEIIKFTGCIFYVAGAFLMSVISIYLDFLSADRRSLNSISESPLKVEFFMTWLGLAEEFFKIYAEVFFIAAALYCLRRVYRLNRLKV